MTRLILTDGTKSIDLPQYPDSAWNFLSNAPAAIEQDLYSRVAPVFRALNLYANVCANLPFAITKNGEDYDTSDDWQNKVGFLANPRDLFRRWYMSIAMTNSAYGFMEGRGTAIKTDLRYLLPSSITPVTEKQFPYGLSGFERNVNGTKKTYTIAEGRIVYIWRLDHTTELLPSKYTEFKALSSAAGILYYSDFFIENYFMRGGVKPTIVAVKGQMSDPTKKDIEGTWDKFVKNISKLRAKVINADAIDIKPFGDGVADLKDSDIFREQCQKIAMAKGMPLSMLLSDYDNFSTAQVYDTAWFRDDVFPFCQWFAHEMNEQVFEPMGLKMVYRLEQTDEGTQDEVDRASAYASYISAGIKPSIAAQIVGIELPNGVEFEDLDPEEKPLEAVPAQAQEGGADTVQPEVKGGPGSGRHAEGGGESNSISSSPATLDGARELVNEWKDTYGNDDVGPFWHEDVGENNAQFHTVRDSSGKLVAGATTIQRGMITHVDSIQSMSAGEGVRLLNDIKSKSIWVSAMAASDKSMKWFERQGFKRQDKPGKHNVIWKQPVNSIEDISALVDFKNIAETKTISYTPTLDELREMDLWEQMAFRKLKQGKSLIFPFEAKTINASVADLIQTRLQWADTQEEIKAAFDVSNINPPSEKTNGLSALVDAINLAASKL